MGFDENIYKEIQVIRHIMEAIKKLSKEEPDEEREILYDKYYHKFENELSKK